MSASRSKPNKQKEKYLAELNDFDKYLDKNITFSFKFFTYGDSMGQCFEEWDKENILADLNNKLKIFSGKTKAELLRDKTLEIYSAYPKGSKFTQPKALKLKFI